MTLADEDTNSIPTAQANRAILDTAAMQLVATCATIASGITWWPNLQPIQVAPCLVAKFAINASGAMQGCIIVFGAWDPKFLAWKYA